MVGQQCRPQQNNDSFCHAVQREPFALAPFTHPILQLFHECAQIWRKQPSAEDQGSFPGLFYTSHAHTKYLSRTTTTSLLFAFVAILRTFGFIKREKKEMASANLLNFCTFTHDREFFPDFFRWTQLIGPSM